MGQITESKSSPTFVVNFTLVHLKNKQTDEWTNKNGLQDMMEKHLDGEVAENKVGNQNKTLVQITLALSVFQSVITYGHSLSAV